jgi:glyoxylase-like metal-dependent hydrolase (beta-lactamase superfamily II)
MTVNEAMVRLSDRLYVHRGAINVGVLRDGSESLLIDLGPGEALGALQELGIERADRVLFTHHHRDQACGVHHISDTGTRIGVPEGERVWFEDVDTYWLNPANRWHIYNFHPHHLMLCEPVRVHEAYADGDVIDWGAARISILATPGHTDGSVSYVVDADGRRTVFCGDLICGEGKVWELHSLQKGTETTDYHGFLGARGQLIESLLKVKKARPSTLVPSHGAIVAEPDRAIGILVARIQSCYNNYASISALRFYFPKMFPSHLSGPGVMPIGAGSPVPASLRHFGTTWVLISKEGCAFAMDCGDPSVIEAVKGLQVDGAIGRVEGLWITHYHDDHVDAAQAFSDEFGCPIITDRHVADVVGNPLAWRLPCISPVAARVDHATCDGESWQWHEFKITAYHFPGQTYYHSGLLVEGEGHRIFFAGDSFTMAGIDDYCCGNRNFLHKNSGFDRCIKLLEDLGPDLIFNSHVDEGFNFTPQQYAFMRAKLTERRREYAELLAWDDPNYGIDELWARCFPYEQHVSVGADISVQVVITNHSSNPRKAECRPVPPKPWNLPEATFSAATIQPRQEGSISFQLGIPSKVLPGRYTLPVDILYGGRLLPQLTETIIKVIG